MNQTLIFSLIELLEKNQKLLLVNFQQKLDIVINIL